MAANTCDLMYLTLAYCPFVCFLLCQFCSSQLWLLGILNLRLRSAESDLLAVGLVGKVQER